MLPPIQHSRLAKEARHETIANARRKEEDYLRARLGEATRRRQQVEREARRGRRVARCPQ